MEKEIFSQEIISGMSKIFVAVILSLSKILVSAYVTISMIIKSLNLNKENSL